MAAGEVFFFNINSNALTQSPQTKTSSAYENDIYSILLS